MFRVFPSVTQSKEFEDLGNLGFTGSLNDRQFKYLRDQGFTGSLNDMLCSPSQLVDPITALFANGEQGAYYDPSDLSTLFQDTAGTTPVTADGQTIALMLDKSGRNNHATTTNLVYRTDGTLHWADFPTGIGESMDATIPVGLSAGWSAVTAVRRGSNAATFVSFRLIANSGANDTYQFSATTSDRIRVQTRALSIGISGFESTLSAIGSFPNDNSVVSGFFRTSENTNEHRINGALSGTSSVANTIPPETVLGTSSTVSVSPPSAGFRLYGLVLIDRQLPGADLAAAETFAADRSGVTL